MGEIRRLIIARHGNTFTADETPRRVGRRTDLPLTQTGREQAIRLGAHLRARALVPDHVIAATLKRTQETAQLATNSQAIETDQRFDEIDYGPDENQEEATVIARVGEQAMSDWNAHAIPPEGWAMDPDQIIQDWQDLAKETVTQPHQTTLLVTSNGIARFAPHITGDFKEFAEKHPLKLATGALGVLEHKDGQWHVREWNTRPK